MKKQVQYSAVHYKPGYTFEIYIRKVRWRLLFVEQWLVPKFVIKIMNTGKDIGSGELSCEIIEHDEPSSFPSVISNFKDFQHFSIKDFKNSDVIKYISKIESRFIKPGRYMIRLLITKWEPSGSSYIETSPGTFVVASPGTLIGISLIDWRWLEVIKVYPVSTFVSLIGAIATVIGIIIAVI